MSRPVRPSIDPAEIGGSPAHGPQGALGLPGAHAAGAAPAATARRGGS
ncbi:hypothetical protein ACGFYY_06175 [Streptomyces sp. NPDC048331]